jgi:glycerol kinase
MSYVLAIDQGTTGSTGLVFADDGAVVGRAYSEFRQHYPQPGWVEHDPEEIWQVSLRVMARALADSGIADRELAAIGITNQRETTVVWERANGKPVYRAIVWQSRQTESICERLRAAGLAPTFRAKTGLVIDPYFSGSKIRWILDRDPELQRRAAAGELAFGTIDSWLLWKLTGGNAVAGALHRTDPTNASRTLLYDIHQRRWDPELCSLLDVPLPMLPEVCSSSGVFGTTEAFEGLPGGVPVAGIAGDQQAALYGQGCWAPGQAKNTYGTGCFLLLNTGQNHRVSHHGLLTTICCDATGAPAYALEGSIFVAGAAVQWLRDGLRMIGSAAETGPLAETADTSQDVVMVPAFVGLGAPYWNPEARGALFGLTRATGPAEIARATLMSVAFQTRDLIEAMRKDWPGQGDTVIRVDGGMVASDWLLQAIADMVDAPVERPHLLETTALGAAWLAGHSAGVWPDQAGFARSLAVERRFAPAVPDDERQRRYAAWQRAVAAVIGFAQH